jgi:hypothetical protein
MQQYPTPPFPRRLSLTGPGPKPPGFGWENISGRGASGQPWPKSLQDWADEQARVFDKWGSEGFEGGQRRRQRELFRRDYFARRPAGQTMQTRQREMWRHQQNMNWQRFMNQKQLGTIRRISTAQRLASLLTPGNVAKGAGRVGFGMASMIGLILSIPSSERQTETMRLRQRRGRERTIGGTAGQLQAGGPLESRRFRMRE